MSYPDVLLVLPPMYQTGRAPDHNPKEPMGLMYIAAYLRRAGYSVEILDADVLALTINQTVNDIVKRKPRIVGFSVMQRALPSVRKIIRKIRNSGMKTHLCCGGITATMSASAILRGMPEIDSIVLGEGETTFTELVQAVLSSNEWRNIRGIAFMRDGEVIVNDPATKPPLEILPWPARDLLSTCFDKTNYATILASRGCYGVCTFCSNQSFERTSVGANWRGRRPSDVVDEICFLNEVHGIRVFKFNDPNMFGPGSAGRRHVTDICHEIIARRIGEIHLMGFCRSNDIDIEMATLMRRAGFERILIGIESSSPSTLSRLHKGESIDTIRKSISALRRVGISIVPGFMMFNPYATLDTLEADIRFLSEYRFTPVLAKSLRIFDGTPIQHAMAAEGRLVERNPFDGYHEYTVDRNLAAVYLALKVIAVNWIDAFKKIHQEEIWKIKKTSSFVQRMDYDDYNRRLFDIEKTALVTIISWIRNGFAHRDIKTCLERLRNKLEVIEQAVVPVAGSRKFVDELDVNEMIESVGAILIDRKSNTFPEQYRWHDD